MDSLNMRRLWPRLSLGIKKRFVSVRAEQSQAHTCDIKAAVWQQSNSSIIFFYVTVMMKFPLFASPLSKDVSLL